MRRLAALFGGLALLAAGCGGGGDAGGNALPDGAEVTPENIPGFVSFNTDFDSEQWQRAQELFKRFPDAPLLLARIQRAFRAEGLDFERDIKPALGPELDLAWLDFQNGGDNLVALTKPDDPAKLKALLAKGDEKMFSRELEGWTVIADTQELLARFEQGGGSLADVDAFKEAMGSVDENSSVRGYVRGRDVQQALDVALEGSGAPPNVTTGAFRLESMALGAKAEERGVSFDGGIRIDPELKPEAYKATLPGDLPKGALLYVSVNSLDDMLRTVLELVAKANPSLPEQIAQVEAAIGVTLEKDVYPLLANEAAVAVYPNRPIPTILFVLKTEGDDEKEASRLVDRITQIVTLSGQAKTSLLDIEGADVHRLDFTGQDFSLFITTHAGKTIVTNGMEAVRGVLGSGDKLDDDPLFNEAKDEAGMPDETTGFVYGNFEQGLPFVYAFAQSQGEVVPPALSRNTKPLKDTLFYTEADGKLLRIAGFLTIQ